MREVFERFVAGLDRQAGELDNLTGEMENILRNIVELRYENENELLDGWLDKEANSADEIVEHITKSRDEAMTAIYKFKRLIKIWDEIENRMEKKESDK